LMNFMLQEMQSQLAQGLDGVPDSAKKANQKPSSTASTPPSKAAHQPSNELDAAIDNLVQGMASQTINNSSFDAASSAATGSTFSLPEALLQGDGWNDDTADALMDGMMEQLLAKDLMYEPMKQVAERFPQWLRDNQSNLSPQEYNEYVCNGGFEHVLPWPCSTFSKFSLFSIDISPSLAHYWSRRRKQSDCFQRLVKAYETDPSNTKRFMELMQEAQEFGQPPPDILKDIAPDLELDANGMPKLDGMAFPSEDECRIM
jgi:peroxin-19